MLISDFKLVPAFFRKFKGSIKINSCFKYEVLGPFGTGYQIRVTGKHESANLRFSRDYAGAIVVTPTGKFEMSAESVFNSAGVKILQMMGQSFDVEMCDELLLAVFIVNHHFAKKTGPFSKRRYE